MLDLSKAADVFARELGLPFCDVAGIRIETSVFGGPGAVETLAAAVSAFKPEQGWLWGDDVGPVAFIDNHLPALTGRLFACELLGVDGSSVHVRHAHADRWIWTHYVETDGADHLVESLSHLMVAPNRQQAQFGEGATLDYRRFWTIEPGSAARIAAARFVGFGGLAK